MDAMWLAVEDVTQPMHGGNLLFYDAHLPAEELMQLILDRMPLFPRFRQRVVYPPFGIASPSWDDDPNFDIRNHVHEMVLPDPADDRVLAETAGRLHSQLLDRGRPLWDMTVLQGRVEGTVVYFKSQHAMVDGPAMMDLLPLLHDPEPGSARAQPPIMPPPVAPDPVAQLQDAVRDRLSELVQLGTDLAFSSMRPGAVADQTRQMTGALTGLMPEMAKPVPSMPWNGSLGTDRRFAWFEVPFERISHIRSALGGTVNDVAMAIMAGGLARYLRDHGHSTAGVELRDMVTVSIRRPEERGTMGNHVASVIAPLYVGIDDPTERLAAERAAMDRVKEQGLAGVMDSMAGLADLVPPVVWVMAAMPRPTMPRPPIRLPQPVFFSVISSNIPGPRRTLHMGGRRLLSWQAIGICMMNIGLFLVVLSYHDKISFSVTVDPALVPDEWKLVEDLRAAFEEMEQAASTSTAPAKEPSERKRSRATADRHSGG
jgi:WS/DGAT/MGAT family acyltransferase